MNYRASLALGGSDARLMCKDFEAWWYKRSMLEQGSLPPWLKDEPSDAQALGTAVHMAFLEPARFARCAVVMPYVTNFALREGKTVKEESLAKARAIEDGFVLRAEQFWLIEELKKNAYAKIVEAFGCLPHEHGQQEMAVFADIDGVECKGQLDWLLEDTVIDLKTTRDINRVQAVAAEERYNVQLAHYAKLAGAKRSAFIWLENQLPFRVAVTKVPDDEFELAFRAHTLALQKYKETKNGTRPFEPF